MLEYNVQFQRSRKSCKTFNFCSNGPSQSPSLRPATSAGSTNTAPMLSSARPQACFNPGPERVPTADMGARRFLRGARAMELPAAAPPPRQHSPWPGFKPLPKELYVFDVAHVV